MADNSLTELQRENRRTTTLDLVLMFGMPGIIAALLVAIYILAKMTHVAQALPNVPG